MKVLYWMELFLPHIGGVEILAGRFLPVMQQRGYEFVVVTSHSELGLPCETVYEGIPVYHFPFRAALSSQDLRQSASLLRRVAELKRDFAPDLTHLHFYGPSVFYHLHTASAGPAPTLITPHILPQRSPGDRSLLKKALDSADWVATVSESMLTEIRQRAPGVSSRSSVIYNGMDVPPIQEAPLPFDPPHVLCLGRMVDNKGFDLALRAVASIVDDFPSLRVTVAGDGPELSRLKGQATELGLGHATEFVGWVDPDEVPALMNSATAVLMPSRAEGLPLVAIQAALMARPVVGTSVDGMPEVVEHQQTGLLVEKDDNTAFAQAISFLLQHPEIAADMGKNAQVRARELFAWENYVDSYDKLYQQLASRTNGQSDVGDKDRRQ